jgi:hypothetical protein
MGLQNRKTGLEQRTQNTRSHPRRQRTEAVVILGGADADAAFVVRILHSFMAYEDNLKRMHSKFVEHRPVQYEMHQLYLDDQPIGHVVTAEKAVSLYYWLADALPDLEKHFRPKKARKPKAPAWLTDPTGSKAKSRKK